MVIAVVAINHKAAHVLDDSSLSKRMRGRRVHAVVTDKLDADRSRSQTWIVEGGDRRFAGLGDERICRSIVRTGRKRDQPPDGIAATRSHSPAFNPSRTNPRRSARQTKYQRPMEIAGDQLNDLILESVPCGIGKGQIVRIGAHP